MSGSASLSLWANAQEFGQRIDRFEGRRAYWQSEGGIRRAMLIQERPSILRSHAQAQLADITTADIVVGIPCYNNQDSIHHVMQAISQGLAKHYPEQRAVIVVADGGSTDDTRERANTEPLPPRQKRIVTIYRGLAGKGSAFRSIFAAAVELRAAVCSCVDSDLRSITPDWMRYLLEPVLMRDYEFVAPLYARHKFDGTITNNLVYCLTRALYGKQIRQPIGGDFAFCQRLARYYLEQPVWETDVARFGIDIWMTLNAIVAQARICQTNLGVKLHDAKDPASALGSMFQQVCGTLFAQIEQDFPFWSAVSGSEAIPVFGLSELQKPDPIDIDHHHLVEAFQQGFQLYQSLYQLIFSPPVFQVLKQANDSAPRELDIPHRIWAKLLYELVVAYHRADGYGNRLIPYLTPLYLGQVASFVNHTRDLDFAEAEAAIATLAEDCEQEKPHLLDLWQQPPDRQQVVRLKQFLNPAIAVN